MEGLLPLIFRAIRKNKSRRKYKCLSSGAALRYNDFYPQNDHDQGYGNYSYNEEPNYISRVDDDDDQYAKKIDFRRHDSVTEFSNGLYCSPKHRTTRSVDSNGHMNYKARTGSRDYVPPVY
ncbi:unnamed protein product [Trifolium pratense]|uniref:Uncharacterized protein n=1 Tax=Trifolium pratense TaxID=57577 RepID=A0ACB0M605_TRIPR|nr:unnamed protein product [Trifolium pratense]